MLRKALAPGAFSPRARAPSRRRFLQAVAGTAGALGAGLLWPASAWAAGRDPMPIPGGFANPVGGPFMHFNFPGPADSPGPGKGPGPNGQGGNEPSTITDFDGYIGQAGIQGTGTGTNTDTGETTPLLYDADLRFMQGVYRSGDGRFLEARFVFI
jgi:hypothetical protein